MIKKRTRVRKPPTKETVNERDTEGGTASEYEKEKHFFFYTK